VKIIDTLQRGDRLYQLADTPVGRVVFYRFGERAEYTQYKNVTNGDVFWHIVDSAEFDAIHNAEPIEIFASKRINGLTRLTAFTADGETYWLAEPKKPDGYIYKVYATNLRIYPRKEYPDMKFVYERFHKRACKALDRFDLERLYFEKVAEFNGGYNFSVYAASKTIDELEAVLSEQFV
jgi:hypothetical protein